MTVTIIAEIGSVHDGSFGNALKLIELAKNVQADVVKFQTHIAGAETLRDAPSPKYFKGEPRFEYFERTAFNTHQWKEIIKKCEECKIGFLSSPFSIEAVELLEDIGAESYKIASGEVTNHPMLERIAETGKSVYLSSGMSNYEELDAAVSIFGKAKNLTIMQCSSIYPCPADQVGLNLLSELRERYRTDVGFSDHTTGPGSAIAAVALGASVIEKHLTFSRDMYGSDASLAMEPNEFAAMVKEAKFVSEVISAPVVKGVSYNYSNMKDVFQKSIVAAYDLPSGTSLSFEMLAFKKPGTGISASEYEAVLGRKTSRQIMKDEMIKIDDLV